MRQKVKISKERLKQIIQEELENIFSEQLWQSNDQKNCERPNKEEGEGNTQRP